MATLLLASSSFYQNLSPFLQTLTMYGASYIDQNYLFPTKIEGSKLQDLKIQTSTYGASIPKCYGTARVSGNIIWGTKFVEHANESGGGKGGGGSSTTNYTYSVSFAVGLGKGPIIGINKVWADGKAFSLYESKYKIIKKVVEMVYSTKNDFYHEVISYPTPTEITIEKVDSESATSWVLTAKNAIVNGESAQVLGVKDSNGNIYPDAYFGIYYNNDLVKFLIDKSSTDTTIPDGQEFYLTVEPHTVKVDYTLHLGTEDQTPDSYIESIEGVGNVPAYRGLAYIVIKDLYIDDYGRRIPNLTFEVQTATSNLKTIVEEISVESGLTTSDIDASDLSSLSVTGYSIEKAASGRDKIEPLMTAFLFDGVEHDGKVYFKRRNTDEAIYIKFGDLGAYESSSKIEPLTITRTDESELPKRVITKYISSDFDYQEQTQDAKRQITTSKEDTSIDTGLVMTDSAAKELAETKLYEAWINRMGYETALASKYADVIPGNILATPDKNGNTHFWIVTKSSYGKPGLNKISGMSIAGIQWGDTA